MRSDAPFYHGVGFNRITSRAAYTIAIMDLSRILWFWIPSRYRPRKQKVTLLKQKNRLRWSFR